MYNFQLSTRPSQANSTDIRKVAEFVRRDGELKVSFSTKFRSQPVPWIDTPELIALAEAESEALVSRIKSEGEYTEAEAQRPGWTASLDGSITVTVVLVARRLRRYLNALPFDMPISVLLEVRRILEAGREVEVDFRFDERRTIEVLHLENEIRQTLSSLLNGLGLPGVLTRFSNPSVDRPCPPPGVCRIEFRAPRVEVVSVAQG